MGVRVPLRAFVYRNKLKIVRKNLITLAIVLKQEGAVGGVYDIKLGLQYRLPRENQEQAARRELDELIKDLFDHSFGGQSALILPNPCPTFP